MTMINFDRKNEFLRTFLFFSVDNTRTKMKITTLPADTIHHFRTVAINRKYLQRVFQIILIIINKFPSIFQWWMSDRSVWMNFVWMIDFSVCTFLGIVIEKEQGFLMKTESVVKYRKNRKEKPRRSYFLCTAKELKSEMNNIVRLVFFVLDNFFYLSIDFLLNHCAITRNSFTSLYFLPLFFQNFFVFMT